MSKGIAKDLSQLQRANVEGQNEEVARLVETYEKELETIIEGNNDSGFIRWLSNADEHMVIPAFRAMFLKNMSSIEKYLEENQDEKEEKKSVFESDLKSTNRSVFEQLKSRASSEGNISKNSDLVMGLIRNSSLSVLQKIITVTEFSQIQSSLEKMEKPNEVLSINKLLINLGINFAVDPKYIPSVIGIRYLISKIESSDEYNVHDSDEVFAKLDDIAQECNRQNLSLAFPQDAVRREMAMKSLYELAQGLSRNNKDIDSFVINEVKNIAMKNPIAEVEMIMAIKDGRYDDALQLAGVQKSDYSENENEAEKYLLHFLSNQILTNVKNYKFAEPQLRNQHKQRVELFLDVLKELIKKNPELINDQDENGLTIFHKLLDIDVVDSESFKINNLLEYFATENPVINLNISNIPESRRLSREEKAKRPERITAVSLAIKRENNKILRILIDQEADLEASVKDFVIACFASGQKPETINYDVLTMMLTAPHQKVDNLYFSAVEIWLARDIKDPEKFYQDVAKIKAKIKLYNPTHEEKEEKGEKGPFEKTKFLQMIEEQESQIRKDRGEELEAIKADLISKKRGYKWLFDYRNSLDNNPDQALSEKNIKFFCERSAAMIASVDSFLDVELTKLNSLFADSEQNFDQQILTLDAKIGMLHLCLKEIIDISINKIIQINPLDPRLALIGDFNGPIKIAGEIDMLRTHLHRTCPKLFEGHRRSSVLPTLSETPPRPKSGSRFGFRSSSSARTIERKDSVHEQNLELARNEFTKHLKLIEEQSNADIPDQDKIKSSFEVIKNILKKADKKTRQELFGGRVNQLTPLGRAIQIVNVELVELFLGFEADPNVMAESEKYPIHLAAEYTISKDKEKQKYENGLKILELIIEHGAKLNQNINRTDAVNTPLHLAASSGNVGAIELLLNADVDPRADPSIESGDTDTPIDFLNRASANLINKYDRGEAVAKFLLCGRPLFSPHKENSAARLEAVILKWFKESYASIVNSYSDRVLLLLSPELALYIDAKNNQIDIEVDDEDKAGTSRAKRMIRIKKLIENNVNLFAKFDGATALQVANREGQNDVVVELVKAHKKSLEEIIKSKNGNDLKKWLENAVESINIPAFKVMVLEIIPSLETFIYPENVSNFTEGKKDHLTHISEVLELFEKLKLYAISNENLTKMDRVEGVIQSRGVSILQKIMVTCELQAAMYSSISLDSALGEQAQRAKLTEASMFAREAHAKLAKNLNIDAKYIPNFIGIKSLISAMQSSGHFDSDKNNKKVFEKLNEILKECEKQNLSLAFSNNMKVMIELYKLASSLNTMENKDDHAFSKDTLGKLKKTFSNDHVFEGIVQSLGAMSGDVDQSVIDSIKKIAIRNPTFELEMRLAVRNEDHYEIMQLASGYNLEDNSNIQSINTREKLLDFLVSGLHDDQIASLQEQINKPQNNGKLKSKSLPQKFDQEELELQKIELKKLQQEAKLFRHILAVTLTDPQQEINNSYIKAVKIWLKRSDNEESEVGKVIVVVQQKIKNAEDIAANQKARSTKIEGLARELKAIPSGKENAIVQQKIKEATDIAADHKTKSAEIESSIAKLKKILISKIDGDLNHNEVGGYKWLYDARDASSPTNVSDSEKGPSISKKFFSSRVGKSPFKKFVAQAKKIMGDREDNKGGNIEDLEKHVKFQDDQTAPYYNLRLEALEQLFNGIIANAKSYILSKRSSTSFTNTEGLIDLDPKTYKLIKELESIVTSINEIKNLSVNVVNNEEGVVIITDNRISPSNNLPDTRHSDSYDEKKETHTRFESVSVSSNDTDSPFKPFVRKRGNPDGSSSSDLRGLSQPSVNSFTSDYFPDFTHRGLDTNQEESSSRIAEILEVANEKSFSRSPAVLEVATLEIDIDRNSLSDSDSEAKVSNPARSPSPSPSSRSRSTSEARAAMLKRTSISQGQEIE